MLAAESLGSTKAHATSFAIKVPRTQPLKPSASAVKTPPFTAEVTVNSGNAKGPEPARSAVLGPLSVSALTSDGPTSDEQVSKGSTLD
jgi:hypothetical protein